MCLCTYTNGLFKMKLVIIQHNCLPVHGFRRLKYNNVNAYYTSCPERASVLKARLCMWNFQLRLRVQFQNGASQQVICNLVISML